jgi:DNA repair protein RadD
MTITLFDFQQDAVVALSRHMSERPVACLPTGSGKSHIAATLLAVGSPSILITHRKELIRQDYDALLKGNNTISAGIYSAGLGRRDTEQQVIFAGVASLYKNPAALGERKLILIDEAHLVQPRSDNAVSGMYGQILSHFRDGVLMRANLAGLTATPYRLDSGLVYGQPECWFDTLVYQIDAKELIRRGRLCKLIGAIGAATVDVDGVRVNPQGEFVGSDIAQASEDEALVKRAIREAVRACEGRRHILVFSCSLNHSQMIVEALKAHGESVGSVSGVDTDRDDRISAFERGAVRWLVNCQILTTGYDFPAIDAIVDLAATASKARHVQKLGRGMRVSDEKEDCLVVDFAGNIERHGAIDVFQTLVPTDEKRIVDEARETKKKAKEEEREKHIARHGRFIVGGDPLEGCPEGTWVETIVDMDIRVVRAKSRPDLKNVLLIYYTDQGHQYRRWLCPEYPTGAHWYARRWASIRGMPFTPNAERFASEARRYDIPTAIMVSHEQDAPYPQVIREYLPSYDTEEETA